MSDFKSEYLKLNSEQKKAVDYIEGPLMVIAGPGTGKTQLLSLRAANILSKTDVLPENILCLTFTESGAQEMRRRLINIIGEAAYRITISTYHGFGSEIIRSNPSNFEGGTNLQPITDLKTDVIIRELQKKLLFTSELKASEMVSAISGLIGDAKKALLSADDLKQVAEANLRFIDETNKITKPLSGELARASFKAVGSFKKLSTKSPDKKLPGNVESLAALWNRELEDAIEETIETRKARALTKWKAKYLVKDSSNLLIAKGGPANERLIEFCGLYKEYVSRLKSEKLYDYDDMILLVIEALKKHDELRFNLQEKYLYIMLDEYQDTNLAQAELTYLLSNNPTSEGRPNVMALGDDDQAIYAFQGAKHSNMLDFTKRYREVKKITLKSNYRAFQPLINLSNQVADQINDRLTTLLEGVNKDFVSARHGKAVISNLKFPNEIEQYAWLAKNIKTKVGSDIGIISPEHKYLERASTYLAAKDIPISYERRENILDDPLIDQIITNLKLLRAINEKDSRSTDIHLATTLNYDFWNLPSETVWRLSWQAHDQQKSWLELILKTKETRTIGLMLLKLAANSLRYRYDFIIDQVIGLSDIVINDPKQKSTRSQFIEYYSKEDDLNEYRLFQNLLVIKEQFRDFNVGNSRPLMINDLTDFIDQLKASGVKLINNFNYSSSSAGVKLMTAHGSKGQEFDSVYLLSLVNEVWSAKSGSYNRITLPPNIDHIRAGAEDKEDERLRLLYVALTRAKNKLVALSYDVDASAKEMTELKFLPLESTPTTCKADLRPLWQSDDVRLEIKTDLQEILKKRLETYSLSATELNSFIDVRHAGPQVFYKNVLLKYSAPVSPRVDYGSAVHDSLEWLQHSLTNSGKLPTLKQLQNEFVSQLKTRRLSADDFRNLSEQGVNSLRAYYEQTSSTFSKDDISEFDFKNEGIVIRQARVSGKVDKLVMNKKDKSITIVDYKTGRAHDRWDSQPRLHNYQNQLYFYKLLVAKSSTFKGYKVSGAALDFVEPDKLSGQIIRLPLDYNEDEMKHLISLIEAVWRHIEELNFPSIAGYKPSLKGIKQFEEDLIAKRI